MEDKKCTGCGKLKPLVDFNKAPNGKFGLEAKCRLCKRGYNRSKTGVIANFYDCQVAKSKKRGHPPPTYNKNELIAWVLAQEIFHVLYKIWKDSNYKTRLRPSCDRLDDYKGYSFDNLQITTAQQNVDKYHEDVKNGINNKRSIAVVRLTLGGEFIDEFYSMSEAARRCGLFKTGISNCCNGKLRTCGGFIWTYKEDYYGEYSTV